MALNKYNLTTYKTHYLIGWAVGIRASFEIWEYKKRVKGTIYKKAFSRLVAGLFSVIGFAVILQMLISLSTYFVEISLATTLLIIYVIILLYGLGFLIISSGARMLSAIEEA